MPKSDSTALITAIDQENFEAAEKLLVEGANAHIVFPFNPDVQFTSGKPLLQILFEKRCYRLAKIALDNKADVHAITDQQTTLLGWALNTKNIPAARLLVEFGALGHTQAATDKHFLLDPDCHFPTAKSSLQTLIENHCLKLAKIALDNKANVHTVTPEQTALLRWCIEKRQFTAAKLLAGYGALNHEPDANGLGENSLHWAVRQQNPIAVRWLLAQGLPINAPNKKGLTALHLAAGINAPEIVQLLLEYGANMDAKDSDNLTPKNYALNKHDDNPNLPTIDLMRKYKHYLNDKAKAARKKNKVKPKLEPAITDPLTSDMNENIATHNDNRVATHADEIPPAANKPTIKQLHQHPAAESYRNALGYLSQYAHHRKSNFLYRIWDWFNNYVNINARIDAIMELAGKIVNYQNAPAGEAQARQSALQDKIESMLAKDTFKPGIFSTSRHSKKYGEKTLEGTLKRVAKELACNLSTTNNNNQELTCQNTSNTPNTTG